MSLMFDQVIHKMKTALLLTITVTVLCGCKPQQNFEQRFWDLEHRCAQLENQNTNLLQQLGALAASLQSTNAAHGAAIADSEFRISNLVSELNRLDDMMRTNLPAVRYQMAVQAAVPQKAATALKNGVPAEVYKTIRAEAALRYPTDWDMQEFVVRQQIEAWQKLNR